MLAGVAQELTSTGQTQTAAAAQHTVFAWTHPSSAPRPRNAASCVVLTPSAAATGLDGSAHGDNSSPPWIPHLTPHLPPERQPQKYHRSTWKQ